MAIIWERAVQSVDRKACSLCIMSIGNFIYLPFWVWGQGLGFGCFLVTFATA